MKVVNQIWRENMRITESVVPAVSRSVGRVSGKDRARSDGQVLIMHPHKELDLIADILIHAIQRLPYEIRTRIDRIEIVRDRSRIGRGDHILLVLLGYQACGRIQFARGNLVVGVWGSCCGILKASATAGLCRRVKSANGREVSCLHRGSKYRGDTVLFAHIVDLLVAAEEKSLVVAVVKLGQHHWPAERISILVPMQNWSRLGRRKKERLRVQSRVLHIVVSAAVQLVGSILTH